MGKSIPNGVHAMDGFLGGPGCRPALTLWKRGLLKTGPITESETGQGMDVKLVFVSWRTLPAQYKSDINSGSLAHMPHVFLTRFPSVFAFHTRGFCNPRDVDV